MQSENPTVIIKREGYTREALIELLKKAVTELNSDGRPVAFNIATLRDKAGAMARSTLVRGDAHKLAHSITRKFRSIAQQKACYGDLKEILDAAA